MLTSLASQCHGPLLLFHKFHFSEIMRNYLDNITYLSQYSKQDEKTDYKSESRTFTFQMSGSRTI